MRAFHWLPRERLQMYEWAGKGIAFYHLAHTSLSWPGAPTHRGIKWISLLINQTGLDMLSIGVVPRDDSIPVERRLSVPSWSYTPSMGKRLYGITSVQPYQQKLQLRWGLVPLQSALFMSLWIPFLSLVLTIGLRELCSGWTILLSLGWDACWRWLYELSANTVDVGALYLESD